MIYGYSLYVLKVSQTALQWLVHLTKLSKHHWCLWIKRCTWPHVTVILLHTFPICSPVLTCVNSCKNTLLAKEITEAQWYSRILNLYTCIPYCLFLTLYTLTSIYMHILHTFLCVLTRRIYSTVKSFFFFDKENFLNNQGIFCQWFNLMDDICKAKLVCSHYLGF